MNYQEFIESFHIHLNRQQLDAVRTIEGPVLLLAVPGSGKTTVLVTRLGYMIYCLGINPESILMLTYTRAAAADMAQRFMSIFGTQFSDKMEFRTINSICDKIIKYYAYEIAGRRPFVLESNEKFLGSIIASIYQKVENTYPTENDIKNARTLITYIKNMGISKDALDEFSASQEFNIAAIYREYQAFMRKNGKMDYDDQMVYALNILRQSNETLSFFQQKYPFICVDEAQDTSKIQHSIISVLAGKSHNLFMVGDEDQSIYGFRAAYPEALLNFEKDHPGSKVLLMEVNFRSTRQIVNCADRLIKHNVFRHEKNMITHRERGSKVRKIEISSRSGQYSYLLKVAQNVLTQAEKYSSGHDASAHNFAMPSETTAVLYRNNESAIPLIDVLERKEIPYRIQNKDLLFFTHRTIVDFRNIISFANDPYNTELFMQIYFKIGLYINKNEAEKACDESLRRRITVLDALEDYCGLSGYRISRVRAVRTNLRKMLYDPSPKAIARIMKALEYRDYLERTGITDEKFNILRILAFQEPDLNSLLNRLDWLKDRIQTKEDDPSCPFILSTIHSSKGLEYDNVFLIDCIDGIFPQEVPDTHSSREELQAFEEERRMYYVAVTRAKNNLSIFALKDEDHTFTDELLGNDKSYSSSFRQETHGSRTYIPSDKLAGRNIRTYDHEYEEFCKQLGQGIAVVHKNFGKGIISDLNSKTITIVFEEYGEKTFYLDILYMKDLLKII